MEILSSNTAISSVVPSVKNENRFFINNDFGDLIIATLSPDGFHEISRTKLIEPTTNCGYGPRRWSAAMVNWVHPAYANRHVITRNDKEIICADLAAGSSSTNSNK